MMNSPDSDENGQNNWSGRIPEAGPSGSSGLAEDNPVHNDCSKKCNAVAEGARPKIRHYNLTNGGDHAKVNNNVGDAGFPCYVYQNGATTSRGCDSESDDLDGYMRNNVDSPSDVEKCPSKVRNGSIDGSGKRKCRRARCSLEEESSSGNEWEEECCVYTYKGSLHADLPSSFFTLDRLANGVDNAVEDPIREPPRDENNRSQAGSSPDNDFLEMDFDPGPSLDQDSEEEANGEQQEGQISPVPELPCESQENDLSAANQSVENAEYVNNVTERRECVEKEPEAVPSPSRPTPPLFRPSPCLPLPSCGCSASSQRSWPARDSWGHHCSSGDLCSPWDASDVESGETFALWNASNNIRLDSEGSLDTRKYNLFSDLYHCIMAKRLVMDKNAAFSDVAKSPSDDESDEKRDSSPPVDRTMIWSEQEACNKQVTQISTSACGATAVINVMMALNTPFSIEKLKKGVATRLRQDSAPLPQYLFSRSVAGATHEDIIRGVDIASEGRLYAKFFAMYPERRLPLSKWLSYWMKKGAVPVATLNLQAGLAPGSPIPDAWHHQMIFGVSPRGVYLTNPLECVPEEALWPQLCSPSVLKIKRNDVLIRWASSMDLRLLMCQTDVRWKKMNVLGQVVNVARESILPTPARTCTQHITIPAAYQSGITLVIPRDSPGFEELQSHPELPLLGH